MTRRALACALAGPALLAVPCGADTSGASAARGGGAASRLWRYLREEPRLADDPRGGRTWLEELGIDLNLFFNHQLGWKLRGGASPPAALRQSGSYDAFVRADFQALGLVPGLQALLHVKGNFHRNVNPLVGALSDPIDDADFDEPIWIDELYAQQSFFEGRTRLRAGYLDQQTLLDRNAYANSEDLQFMATFLDNNPIVPLKVGLGAALLLAPAAWLELVIGTADADNRPRIAGFETAFDTWSSLMGYFEADFGLRLPSARGPLPGSYRIGLFVDGSRRTVFGQKTASGAPLMQRGHLGCYLSFDQLVLRERAEGAQGLGLFARWGRDDGDVNRIEQFWSLGLEYLGLLPGRDADLLGLGMYQAIGSDRYREQVDPDFDRETGFEGYYRIQLAPWLTLTPDVQLIVDPGGDRSARNVVVLIWRTRVTF